MVAGENPRFLTPLEDRFPHREAVVSAAYFAGVNVGDVIRRQLNIERLALVDIAPHQGSALTN